MMYVAAAFTVAFAVAFIVLGLVSAVNVDRARVVGWTWSLEGDAWVVRSVDAAGPAAGLIEPGDRILAVNGDRRIGTVGPRWVVPHASPQDPYSVTVARDGVETTVTLRQRVVRDAGFRVLFTIYLLAALAFAAVAVVMIASRPRDRAIQGGFWGSAFIAFFFLWLATRPYDGVLQGPMLQLQLLVGSTFPLYLWGGYRFFVGFPEDREETGLWKSFGWVVFVGALAIWLPRTLLNVVEIPRGSAVDLASALWPALRGYVVLGPYLETAFLMGVLAGCTAAVARNYRRLPEGDLRRRIRWVALSVIGSAVLVSISALVETVTMATDASAAVKGMATRLKMIANAMVITQPLALGYAIARHRVMGIQPVFRLGLRYLLAKGALQGVVALPAAWLVWRTVSSPDATVGELLFQGAGRVNLAVVVAGAVLLRYRKPVREALDRAFFREAYDQERILIALVDDIKELDSLQEIARMVSSRVDAALHVERVVILFRNEREQRFEVGYSSEDSGARAVVPGTSGLLTRLEDTLRPLRWDQIRPDCTPEERSWLDRLDLELVVPILGVDQGLVGVLLLGVKKSEEPYSPRDRTLLQTITNQVGAIHEVLSLRATVSRDRRLQKEVLGRLSEQNVNVLKECPSCGRCYDRDDERCSVDDAALELSLPVERTLVGRYQLLRVIGKGGMGAVFEATDLRLQRVVAVKIMMGALFGDPKAQRRFAREAQASARLVHPNIIRVYDFGELAGEGAYLVMERVEGPTWGASVLEQGGFLPPPAAAPLLAQLMDGVHAAHEGGVVHRDLKPENLLLGRSDTGDPLVKILDFGLAKVREMGMADPKSATATGMIIGTLGYMSPEQFFGDDVDQRTDVYSIGVIALETLTGKLHRRGFSVHAAVQNQLEARLAHSGAPFPALELARVLTRALAWEKKDRYPTVANLQEDLVPAVVACGPRLEGRF